MADKRRRLLREMAKRAEHNENETKMPPMLVINETEHDDVRHNQAVRNCIIKLRRVSI